VSQSKSARGKSASKTSSRPLSPAQHLDVKPTAEDRALASLLSKLHNDKRTPEIFQGTIFQLVWDLTRRYDVPLPKHWTRHLPSILAALVCHQRARAKTT
jgi:hypothetical protein